MCRERNLARKRNERDLSEQTRRETALQLLRRNVTAAEFDRRTNIRKRTADCVKRGLNNQTEFKSFLTLLKIEQVDAQFYPLKRIKH